MQLIKVLFINGLGKLVALLLNGFRFLGNGYLRWFAVLLGSCIIAVCFFAQYPLNEHVGEYALGVLLLSGFFEFVDFVRVKILGKEKYYYKGIEQPEDDEERDFPYEKYKNKHWWSFLYWSGWFVLIFSVVFMLLVIIIFTFNTKMDKDDILFYLSFIIFSFIFNYPVIRDALRRQKSVRGRKK